MNSVGCSGFKCLGVADDCVKCRAFGALAWKCCDGICMEIKGTVSTTVSTL
jgi:hypothetical protein